MYWLIKMGGLFKHDSLPPKNRNNGKFNRILPSPILNYGWGSYSRQEFSKIIWKIAEIGVGWYFVWLFNLRNDHYFTTDRNAGNFGFYYFYFLYFYPSMGLEPIKKPPSGLNSTLDPTGFR